MPDTEDTIPKLQEAMLQPKKVEVDDKKVENHDLQDLIAMDKYLSAKKAMARRSGGLKFTKFEAGGAAR